MKSKNIKQNKNKYPLVKVTWRDSNIYRYQDSIEYALDNYAIEVITTIGFLIGYQGKNPIVTRDLMNNNLDQRSTVVIPVENIVSLIKIKTKGSEIDLDEGESAWAHKMDTRSPVDKKSLK